MANRLRSERKEEKLSWERMTRMSAAVMVAAALCAAQLQVACAGDSCCKAGIETAMMPDPVATIPTDWDVEDDGVWEAPPVPVSSVRGFARFEWELRSIAADSVSWLFAGLIVAGAARLLLPSAKTLTRATTILGPGAVGQAMCGAMVGLLLPCCSCGVLPVAAGLIDAGSSATAAIALTFVSSGSGIDSLLYTIGVAGYGVAVARMVCVALLGVLTACATASCVDSAAMADASDTVGSSEGIPKCGGGTVRQAVSCCDGPDSVVSVGPSTSWVAPANAIWTVIDGMVTALEEVAVPISLGMALTAASTAWPLDGPAAMLNDAVASAKSEDAALSTDVIMEMVVNGGRRAVLIGATVPMQMCEHAVIHVATALIGQGVSPGTAFAVLLVSPATGMGWLMLIARHRGVRATLSATVTTVVAAVVLSYTLDFVVGGTFSVPTGPGGAAILDLPLLLVNVAPAGLAALGSISLLRKLRSVVGSPVNYQPKEKQC